MDSLSSLFARFSLSAKVFYSGSLCEPVTFEAQPGFGYIHVLREGQVKVKRDGKSTLDVLEPSLLFVPRPMQHRFQVDDPCGAQLVCATIDFGVGVGNPVLHELPELLVIPLANIASIDTILTLLFEEALTPLPGRQAAVDRLIEYFLVRLLRYTISAELVKAGVLAGLADARLAKALTLMHANPAHPWTLEELGSAAGMSRARFAAHFRTTTGVTALDYLTDWRISVSQTMLKRGQSIKLIAPMVGYSSAVAFTRVFVRRVGMSPAEWLARK